MASAAGRLTSTILVVVVMPVGAAASALAAADCGRQRAWNRRPLIHSLNRPSDRYTAPLLRHGHYREGASQSHSHYLTGGGLLLDYCKPQIAVREPASAIQVDREAASGPLSQVNRHELILEEVDVSGSRASRVASGLEPVFLPLRLISNHKHLELVLLRV